MDPFTLIVSVTLGLGLVVILLLGFFHPRTGAEILDWKPTRSPEVEAQNELDDVAQMIAAQNLMRERRGAKPRTIEHFELQVRDDQEELRRYAEQFFSDQRATQAVPAGEIVVYEKNSCSNCQRLARILTERGVDFDRVDFWIDPLPAGRIRELLGKAGVTARQALREKEPGAAVLLDASEEEILAAMEADQTLLQRPIVERGDRAVLARPAERVLDLL